MPVQFALDYVIGLRRFGCPTSVEYALAFERNTVDHSFAMAIGDAFIEQDLAPFEWAYLGHQAHLQPRLLATQLARMAERLRLALPAARQAALEQGADLAMIDKISAVVDRMIRRHVEIAKTVADVEPTLFT